MYAVKGLKNKYMQNILFLETYILHIVIAHEAKATEKKQLLNSYTKINVRPTTGVLKLADDKMPCAA